MDLSITQDVFQQHRWQTQRGTVPHRLHELRQPAEPQLGRQPAPGRAGHAGVRRADPHQRRRRCAGTCHLPHGRRQRPAGDQDVPDQHALSRIRRWQRRLPVHAQLPLLLQLGQVERSKVRGFAVRRFRPAPANHEPMNSRTDDLPDFGSCADCTCAERSGCARAHRIVIAASNFEPFFATRRPVSWHQSCSLWPGSNHGNARTSFGDHPGR